MGHQRLLFDSLSNARGRPGAKFKGRTAEGEGMGSMPEGKAVERTRGGDGTNLSRKIEKDHNTSVAVKL